MIPLVVHVEELGSGAEAEQFAFIKSPVRIGRGELNDLPLQRPFVSTYHGLLQFDDEEAHYLDLGSTNGSILDGVQLERKAPARVVPGSELLIGNFRLTFERRSTAERPAVPRAMTAFAMRASMISGLRRQPGAAEQPPPAPPSLPPVAPAPPAAPEPDEAARAAAAIEAVSLDLDLQYASYRGTWEHLRSAFETAVAGLEGPSRRAALDQLAARYGAVVQEPQFASLRGEATPAAAPPAAEALIPAPLPAVEPLAAGVLQLFRAFAESYLPETTRVDTPQEAEALLARVAVVLETFARSYLELHHGYEEFGKEMGVRAVQAEGALHRARDPRELVAYVLDQRAEGRDRELQRAFADFMIHQLALLRGVEEGAQALVARLSPEAISAQAPQSVWPLRAAALWKAFEQRFRELAEDDRALADVLFGKEFARAYASMVGRRSDEDEREPGRSAS